MRVRPRWYSFDSDITTKGAHLNINGQVIFQTLPLLNCPLVSGDGFYMYLPYSVVVGPSLTVHTLTHVPFVELGKQRQLDVLVWVLFSWGMFTSSLPPGHDFTKAGGVGKIDTFSKGMRQPFFLLMWEAVCSST